MENLFSSENIRILILSIVPFLLAVTIHELSHGVSAYMLGDDTAKRAGRLTLNPIAHIDPLGLLALVITRMIGWAKPVPVNYFIVSKKKFGMAIVAFAGPLSNLVLAIVSAGILKLLQNVNVTEGTMMYKILVPMATMVYISIRINVALFVFNLLPILPMDGGRILNDFLPRDLAVQYSKTERYGFIIIIVLLATHIIDKVLFPAIYGVMGIFETVFNLNLI